MTNRYCQYNSYSREETYLKEVIDMMMILRRSKIGYGLSWSRFNEIDLYNMLQDDIIDVNQLSSWNPSCVIYVRQT